VRDRPDREGSGKLMNQMRLALPLMLAALLITGTSCVASSEKQRADRSRMAATSQRVTLYPLEITDTLYNPGMGFADFHFGFDHPPAPGTYPRSTVAYFRWSWADLEPAEGQYAFNLIDRTIEQAKAKGERLAFRVMSEYRSGPPAWLLAKGVPAIAVGGSRFPDYNNPIFLDYHEKLIKALGTRYGQSPDIDHVDIGSIGCWGEWNMACCQGVERQCQQYFPTEDVQILITDWYFKYFPQVPLVMLHNGQLRYAAGRGAGWRGDCFGDYGYFGPDWNHMEQAYPPVLQDPVIAAAWTRGPVQFEVCGVMQDWEDKGFDIDRILQQGLDWHVSVLNAKSSPVPARWRSKVNEFLKKIGYRLVLRTISHPAKVRVGPAWTLQTEWENIGVAPVYRPWPLAFRLRNSTDDVVTQWTSHADVKQWLPGTRYQIEDTLRIPAQIASGVYRLDVAVLHETGKSALLELGIEGKRADGWYDLSTITIDE
ncbi:MAG TPA: DUF4832 domain-containing protein, partial [Nitrospira sp.]